MGTIQRKIALAIGLGLCATTLLSTSTGATTSAASEPSESSPAASAGGLGNAPGVRAFAQAYAPLIDSVTLEPNDVVFTLAGQRIRFQGGRLLSEARLDSSRRCDPVFYRYPLGPLTEPPAADEDMPTYCTDVQETLWGDREDEIRGHGRSVTFLDHRMFVNELIVSPLEAVETQLRRKAVQDPEVAAWIDDLDITYSFVDREIEGSETRSQHAWGLAVDLVPRSYHGRHVYWQWSRVYDREGWDRIPVEQRWSPPQAVIQTFEAQGFVWGGKWAHFDMIHFEYRPEILLYNRLTAEAEQ